MLLFFSFNAQAGMWDCDPETEHFRGPISSEACFEGEQIIFDIHGTGYIDDGVRSGACSSGKTNIGLYCGKTGDNGEQHSICRRGMVQVCRFCPREEQKDLDDLATVLNVDVANLQTKCHAIENTPEDFKKVKLTCEQFVDLSQGLKAKFVDVVNAFDNLIYNMEKQFKGSSDHVREFLVVPPVITPAGHEGAVCAWTPIPDYQGSDETVTPALSQSNSSSDMIIVTNQSSVGYRPGFEKESDYNMSDENFKGHMFEWTSYSKDIIKGQGGFLETLDGFGYSPTVSKVRQQITVANRVYDEFTTISLMVSEDNFEEWKSKALEVKALYLSPYLEDVAGFYFKPQKSSDEYKED